MYVCMYVMYVSNFISADRERERERERESRASSTAMDFLHRSQMSNDTCNQ